MATSVRLTYEDYLKLPDDGNRYEIIDGELIVNPSPVPDHQRVIRNLCNVLDRYFEDFSGGEVLPSPIDVVLAPDQIVQPDVIVVLAAHAAIVGRKNVVGAPDLVVEVLSDATRRRDEMEKRKLYDQHGVTEYWIVDSLIETVKIYRRTGDDFPRVAEIGTERGGTITSPLLPGFTLDVARAWRSAGVHAG